MPRSQRILHNMTGLDTKKSTLARLPRFAFFASHAYHTSLTPYEAAGVVGTMPRACNTIYAMPGLPLAQDSPLLETGLQEVQPSVRRSARMLVEVLMQCLHVHLPGMPARTVLPEYVLHIWLYMVQAVVLSYL